MKLTIPVGESRTLQGQGEYLYLSSATGKVRVTVVGVDGKRAAHLVRVRFQIRIHGGIREVEVENLHTTTNVVDIETGTGEFITSNDGQKVTLTGQDIAIEVQTATGAPIEVESTDAKPVRIINKTGTTLAVTSVDLGGIGDAVAGTDTGNFSLIALVKRLLTKLPGMGQATMANSQPVVLASDQSALAITATDIGLRADAAATTDAGTFSLIALVKRLLGKLPAALGQTTMTGSLPVVIASNQSALSVTPGALVAGTAAIGDVGTQYRANATGAALISHVVAAGTTNAANVKASAGRVIGWNFANTTASWRFVKLHNSAAAPTAGAGVVLTISIPPNGVSVVSLAGGIGFSTGIGRTIVTGSADADATAVTAGDVLGELFYA